MHSKWYKVWDSLCLAFYIHWHIIVLRNKPGTVCPLIRPNIWLATGWMVRGLNPGGAEIFRTRPDQLWCPPSLLYSGYRVFPGVQSGGVWRWPPTPSGAEVKEREELYLYSPSGTLWPVIMWILLWPVIKWILRFTTKYFCCSSVAPCQDISRKSSWNNTIQNADIKCNTVPHKTL